MNDVLSIPKSPTKQTYAVTQYAQQITNTRRIRAYLVTYSKRSHIENKIANFKNMIRITLPEKYDSKGKCKQRYKIFKEAFPSDIMSLALEIRFQSLFSLGGI